MSIEKNIEKDVREPSISILGKSPSGQEIRVVPIEGDLMHIQETIRGGWRKIFRESLRKKAMEIMKKQELPILQKDLGKILLSSMQEIKKEDISAFKTIGILKNELKSWKDEKGRVWLDLVEK